MPQKGTAGSSPVHPATFKARKVKLAGFFAPKSPAPLAPYLHHPRVCSHSSGGGDKAGILQTSQHSLQEVPRCSIDISSKIVS